MIEVEGKVRKWGRSLGIIIPRDKVKSEGIRENQSIKMIIAKKGNVLRETFGAFKFKKSTEEMLKESDKELYND
jgi:antitoxin component of MazEF toxin-antitoxin module|tara:strand:+ start:752 stop:973 length:222 start_codon:yes stop_codon:yes gene_type:complete